MKVAHFKNYSQNKDLNQNSNKTKQPSFGSFSGFVSEQVFKEDNFYKLLAEGKKAIKNGTQGIIREDIDYMESHPLKISCHGTDLFISTVEPPFVHSRLEIFVFKGRETIKTNSEKLHEGLLNAKKIINKFDLEQNAIKLEIENQKHLQLSLKNEKRKLLTELRFNKTVLNKVQKEYPKLNFKNLEDKIIAQTVQLETLNNDLETVSDDLHFNSCKLKSTLGRITGCYSY